MSTPTTPQEQRTLTERDVSLDERIGRLRTASFDHNFREPWAQERIRVELPALLDRLAALSLPRGEAQPADLRAVALEIEAVIDHTIESDAASRCFDPPSPYALEVARRIDALYRGAPSAVSGEVRKEVASLLRTFAEEWYRAWTSTSRAVVVPDPLPVADRIPSLLSPASSGGSEDVRDVLEELCDIIDGLHEDGLGAGRIDSFTLQPARALLARLAALPPERPQPVLCHYCEAGENPCRYHGARPERPQPALEPREEESPELALMQIRAKSANSTDAALRWIHARACRALAALVAPVRPSEQSEHQKVADRYDDFMAVIRDTSREVRDDLFALPEPAPIDAEKELAGVIREMGLERDDYEGAPWFLPAEPGPLECATVADAVREALRLAEQDGRRSSPVRPASPAQEVDSDSTTVNPRPTLTDVNTP